MPSVLSENDKETVRRTVPKPANKIHAVAVARLYVAYPNRQRWTYTGLQGAVVLAEDLVGKTFWLKLVDVSTSSRGVLWDQEIYNNFNYNQDRTFFHSFELEDCLAGLLFVDEKEAKTFKKKIDDREKNASKATRSTPFQGSGSVPQSSGYTNGKPHSRFGGIGNFLHGGHRTSSAPRIPHPQVQTVAAPQELSAQRPTSSPDESRGSSLDSVDPSWRGLLDELLAMGITEDQIEEHADFIKSYIEEKKANENNGVTSSNGNDISSERRNSKLRPIPPAMPPSRLASISPQNTGNTLPSKRGPPPAIPPARGSRTDISTESPKSSAPELPERTFKFKAPPPIEGAGKLANSDIPAPSISINRGPTPPPRPLKIPVEDDTDKPVPRFGVPPPFQSERNPITTYQVPPDRGSIPTPPRSAQESVDGHPTSSVPVPPPLPLKIDRSASSIPPPKPIAGNTEQAFTSPPPLPPKTDKSISPIPIPKPIVGSNDLLASIRSSGGIQSGRLRKVSSQERRDRSAAVIPGASSSSNLTQTPAAGNGLADALATVLSQRNKKVSASDDEDDEDDWDDPPKRK